MPIHTRTLYVLRTTTIRFCEKTQATLNERSFEKGVAVGGRYFRRNKDGFEIQLDGNRGKDQFRDSTLLLDPPVDIFVKADDKGQKYNCVAQIKFVGEQMQIVSNEDPKQKELERLEAERNTQNEQLQQLQSELEQLRNRKRELEQEINTEEQQITQLSDTATSVKQSKAALEATNGDIQQLQNEKGKLDDDLAHAAAQYSTLTNEVEQKRKEYQDQQTDNSILTAEIKSWNSQLEAERNAHSSLEQERDRLIEECKKFGPDVLANLRGIIQTLEAQYSAAVDEWNSLSGEKRVKEKLVADQTASNAELVFLIEQQPIELRELQTAHEKLIRRLEETKHAQEMCSEEKQSILREQIDALEPIVNSLREQHGALTKEADALRSTMSELQQANEQELLTLWPQLIQSITDIKACVGETNAQLESIQADAEQFSQHVRDCADRMERLKEWYHVDQTPLQKLLTRLGELTPSENELLRRTMNPENCERIRQLFETVESGLNDLDDILKEVITASQADERFLNLRATTNDQHARQEMKR